MQHAMGTPTINWGPQHPHMIQHSTPTNYFHPGQIVSQDNHVPVHPQIMMLQQTPVKTNRPTATVHVSCLL